MIRHDLPSEQVGGLAFEPEPAGGFEVDQPIATRPIGSPTEDAWRRFRRNWAAMFSLVVILALFFLAIFAPTLHTTDPMTQHYDTLDFGPSPHHWFGTDNLGRDQYTRLLYGLRAPLLAGVVGAAITTILGTILGVIAGYFGGLVDALLSRFTDLVFAFPGFTLALIVVSLYGNALDNVIVGAGRLIMLIVVFAVVGWPGLMRFVRSLTLAMKEQQFIEAARTSGSTPIKIMLSHFLPNMWGVILVQAGFVVISFVYTEATLSIFGLGVEPPNPDLGQMLFNGTSNMGVSYWEVLFPSLFLVSIFLAFTFLADGLRDAFDPRAKG
jgi:ABC-type dipeptide/oligopeptide/nickel transport system permease subunit